MERGLSRIGLAARLLEVVVLTGVFIAWTGFGLEALVFGIVAAVLATWIRRQTGSGTAARWSPKGVIEFVPYFLRVSLVGGIDVARRAWSPSMPLNPGFVVYPLRLEPDGPAAVFFAAVISLVPGTLCAELDGETSVVVHLLDRRASVEEELIHLEQKVARLFGTSIDEADPPAIREEQ